MSPYRSRNIQLQRRVDALDEPANPARPCRSTSPHPGRPRGWAPCCSGSRGRPTASGAALAVRAARLQSLRRAAGRRRARRHWNAAFAVPGTCSPHRRPADVRARRREGLAPAHPARARGARRCSARSDPSPEARRPRPPCAPDSTRTSWSSTTTRSSAWRSPPRSSRRATRSPPPAMAPRRCAPRRGPARPHRLRRDDARHGRVARGRGIGFAQAGLIPFFQSLYSCEGR